MAGREPLRPAPAAPYPVIISETHTASRQPLVPYRGNRYSMPPELAAAHMVVSHPVGGQFCDIATTGGIVVAGHRMAADGLGVMVRDAGHVIALDTAAMATATTGRPHRRKERIPPGPAAKAAAAHLRQIKKDPASAVDSATASTDSTIIDLSAYERAAQNRTIPSPQHHAPPRPPSPALLESPRRPQRAAISSWARICSSSNSPRPPKPYHGARPSRH